MGTAGRVVDVLSCVKCDLNSCLAVTSIVNLVLTTLEFDLSTSVRGLMLLVMTVCSKGGIITQLL